MQHIWSLCLYAVLLSHCSACYLTIDLSPQLAQEDEDEVRDAPADLTDPGAMLDTPQDASEPDDLARGAQELDDSWCEELQDVIVPEDWLDEAWSSRHGIDVQIDWAHDIVLPVRVPGAWSTARGRDLRFVLDDEELAHDMEHWVEALDNVAWVRFPRGLERDQRLWVYTDGPSEQDDTTARAALTWQGRARHVYHFDAFDSMLEEDHAAYAPNPLLKAVSNQGYTYTLPNEQMGHAIKLDGQSEALESSSTPSPIHLEQGEEATIEVHLRFDDINAEADRATFLSDTNGCVGSRFTVSHSNLQAHHAIGSGCSHEGHPASSTAQATIDFPDSRVYLTHPYMLFARQAWEQDHMIMQVLTRSQSAPDNQTRSSPPVTIPPFEHDMARTPERLLVGKWPFDEREISITLDTLIVHSRWLSDGEIDVIWRATQTNHEVFSPGKSEHLNTP